MGSTRLFLQMGQPGSNGSKRVDRTFTLREVHSLGKYRFAHFKSGLLFKIINQCSQNDLAINHSLVILMIMSL